MVPVAANKGMAVFDFFGTLLLIYCFFKSYQKNRKKKYSKKFLVTIYGG
jgi:uncharacterized membrane protein